MAESPSPPSSVTSRRVLLGTSALAVAGTALAARAESATSSSVAMRHAGRSGSTPDPLVGLPPTPSAGVVALNRMAFGPRPGDLAAFDALGGNDASRLAAYVAQQLDPDSIDDSEFETRLASAGYASYDLSDDPDTLLATLWDWYINGNAPGGNNSSGIPRDEMWRATFLRAMYSKRQLMEVLADFWHDHFNVNINYSSSTRATFQHLDLVLRQNQLGSFRSMLEAVARSTAMLRYLDNYTSTNAGPNENFSRELFELHTLGAENYLGVLPQSEVPLDGNGKPIGYVDADVFESVRCFTGWSYSFGSGGDGDTGLFYYRSEGHDRFQKNVLGIFIPQDQVDLKDGRDVLDALAAHPGTGRHIARKLCRRLISDDPPQNVIDAAAAVFTAQWQAPDQLKQVMETILLSPEFQNTWGQKVKRPFEIAASALRAGGADFTPRMDDSDTSSFFSRYDDAGHHLFTWPAPNGFPDVRAAWQRMTPRVMSWRLSNWLIDFDDTNGVFYLDIIGQTPAQVRTANDLADFWIDRVLGRPMSADDRQQIVQFMAQGINPDFDLDLTNSNTSSRLRSMVGLLFMSPDFLWR